MLYKPQSGHMWDTSIVFHEDKYYLFSMFRYFGEEERQVWCAVSEDGVHFKDVGPVAKDTMPVWKMFVHKCGDRFAMNYGSLSGKPGHGNDTLRYWESGDLLHWEFCEEQRSAHPDPRWYREEQRWDHMYTVENAGKYYGFVVATAKEELNSFGCGMMESEDGIHWDATAPVKFEWNNIPPINFEVGGCEKIGDKYYLLGGYWAHQNNQGYSVYVYEAEDLFGPFRPVTKGYRLCGASHTDKYKGGVQWLASFAKGRGGELLITNYVTAQHNDIINFIGTYQNVWFAPIKKALVDEKGILRMAYWTANDCLKGRDITPEARKTETNIWQTAAGDNGTGEEYVYKTLIGDIPESGVFIEGIAKVASKEQTSPVRFGFAFKSAEGMRSITLEAGEEAETTAEIFDSACPGDPHRRLLDVVHGEDAGKTNFVCGEAFSFRLLYHEEMFELYVEDILVQTYLTPEQVTEIGFYQENADVCLQQVNVYEMNL